MNLYVFLLDISGSMSGVRIATLCDNLSTLFEKISGNEKLLSTTLVSVYTFNDFVNLIIPISKPISEKFNLATSGGTNLDNALQILIADLNKSNEYKILTKHVFVFTDGDFGGQTHIKEIIKNAIIENNIVVQFVGIGNDLGFLKEISLNDYPPISIHEIHLTEVFREIEFIIARQEEELLPIPIIGTQQKKQVLVSNAEDSKPPFQKVKDFSLFKTIIKSIPLLLVLIILCIYLSNNNAHRQAPDKALTNEVEVFEKNNVKTLNNIVPDSLKNINKSKIFFLKLSEPIDLGKIVDSYKLEDQFEEYVVFNLLCEYNSNILAKNGYTNSSYKRGVNLNTAYIKSPNFASLLIENEDVDFFENAQVKFLGLKSKQKSNQIKLLTIEKIKE